jgi:hypothetical protein
MDLHLQFRMKNREWRNYEEAADLFVSLFLAVTGTPMTFLFTSHMQLRNMCNQSVSSKQKVAEYEKNGFRENFSEHHFQFSNSDSRAIRMQFRTVC